MEGGEINFVKDVPRSIAFSLQGTAHRDKLSDIPPIYSHLSVKT